jgi:hypothetical protein
MGWLQTAVRSRSMGSVPFHCVICVGVNRDEWDLITAMPWLSAFYSLAPVNIITDHLILLDVSHTGWYQV